MSKMLSSILILANAPSSMLHPELLNIFYKQLRRSSADKFKAF